MMSATKNIRRKSAMFNVCRYKTIFHDWSCMQGILYIEKIKWIEQKTKQWIKSERNPTLTTSLKLAWNNSRNWRENCNVTRVRRRRTKNYFAIKFGGIISQLADSGFVENSAALDREKEKFVPFVQTQQSYFSVFFLPNFPRSPFPSISPAPFASVDWPCISLFKEYSFFPPLFFTHFPVFLTFSRHFST